MAYHKCDGIILRRTRFSESSLVVVIFTREFGRVEALAKGCRRPKSPMRGRLDLFNREELVIWDRSRGSLDLVTETDIIAEYTCLRRDPVAYAAATLLGEILRAACMVRDPHPRAYDALTIGLAALDGGASVGTTLLTMLLALLQDLGFTPRVDGCAHCDGDLPRRRPLVLSGLHGGLLCEACGVGAVGQRLTIRATASLRYRMENSAAALNAQPLDEVAMIQALVRYTEDVLERGLKSKKFLLRQLRRAATPAAVSA